MKQKVGTYISSIYGIICLHEEFLWLLDQTAWNKIKVRLVLPYIHLISIIWTNVFKDLSITDSSFVSIKDGSVEEIITEIERWKWSTKITNNIIKLYTDHNYQLRSTQLYIKAEKRCYE